MNFDASLNTQFVRLILFYLCLHTVGPYWLRFGAQTFQSPLGEKKSSNKTCPTHLVASFHLCMPAKKMESPSPTCKQGGTSSGVVNTQHHIGCRTRQMVVQEVLGTTMRDRQVFQRCGQSCCFFRCCKQVGPVPNTDKPSFLSTLAGLKIEIFDQKS